MPTTATRKPTAAEKRFAARLDSINEKADADLIKLAASVTQGEWLAIRRALDLTRAEISEERSLMLTVLAYVKEKREHGAASWDVILDKTDEEIARLHGYMGEDDLKALELEERKGEGVKNGLTPDGH